MDRTILPGEDQRGHKFALKGGREPKELHRLKSGDDNPGSAIFTLSQKKKQDLYIYITECAKSNTQISSQVQVPDG